MSVVFGITGGIGSGKSYIANIFRHYGMPVYDTDTMSKEIVKNNISLKNQLISLLGEEIYINGEINKPLLVKYIFDDNEYGDKINTIIHPYVTDDVISWINENSVYKIVAVESAILLQSDLIKVIDKIVVVDAPVEFRIERAMKRDSAERNLIESRIAKQITNEEMIQKADYVINNDGNCEIVDQIREIIMKNLL